MRYLKLLGHILMIILLTGITQVGGLVYILTLLLFKKFRKRLVVFILLYSITVFLIIPQLAPIFGRMPVTVNDQVKIHAFFTRLANRHYVTPELNAALQHSALDMRESYDDFEMHVLDANFPFFDGFPLWPHLSHNDGKKVDIALQYVTIDGKMTNAKPSRSGYGIFEEPLDHEYDQIKKCITSGYWQYDFPKYLTFGTPNRNLIFDANSTKRLLQNILRYPQVGKIFIEPHLKTRLGLSSDKLRYHGCRAVRHDDHIHVQLR